MNNNLETTQEQSHMLSRCSGRLGGDWEEAVGML